MLTNFCRRLITSFRYIFAISLTFRSSCDAHLLYYFFGNYINIYLSWVSIGSICQRRHNLVAHEGKIREIRRIRRKYCRVTVPITIPGRRNSSPRTKEYQLICWNWHRSQPKASLQLHGSWDKCPKNPFLLSFLLPILSVTIHFSKVVYRLKLVAYNCVISNISNSENI